MSPDTVTIQFLNAWLHEKDNNLSVRWRTLGVTSKRCKRPNRHREKAGFRMLNRLKGLVNRKIGPGNDDDTTGFLFFPNPRPGRLTPSPSREELRLRPFNLAAGTSKSLFFQRLPEEIRRLILIDAFGGRTVHLDLDSLDDEHRGVNLTPIILRGEALQSKIDIGNPGHYGLWKGDTRFPGNEQLSRPVSVIWNLEDMAAVRRPNDNGDDSGRSRSWRSALRRSRVKKKEAPEWEWWGSVCHQDVEWRMREEPSKRLASEPWRDRCREGKACCDAWAGDLPDKCILGVMGWLLSCRQAYAVGIEVLYATNTIHMHSVALMLNLPKLLLPQRLAMITSLEMVWEFKVPLVTGQGTLTRDEELRRYLQRDNTVLSGLFANLNHTTFPHLRRLSISLSWDPIVGILHKGEEAAKRVIDELLVPLDGMVRQFPSTLRDCNVGILCSLFYVLAWASWDGLKREPQGMYSWDGYVGREIPCARIWRPLLPGGEGDDRGQDKPEGYWICEGLDDYGPYPFAHINPDYDMRNFFGRRRSR